MSPEGTLVAAALAGGAATALALYLFARIQRWRWRDLERTRPLAALQRRFRAWEVAGMVLLIGFIGASWLALLAVAAAFEPGAALHFVGPGVWHWGIVAFFAGNVVAIGPTHLLFRWLMGAEVYADFRHYQRRKFGFDSRAWLVPFSLTFGTAVILVVGKMLGWGATFTGESVILRSFWGNEVHRYAYDQVMEVGTHAAPGGTTLRLRFADDRLWSATRDPDLVEAVARTVSEHSGLPIVRSLEMPADD